MKISHSRRCRMKTGKTSRRHIDFASLVNFTMLLKFEYFLLFSNSLNDILFVFTATSARDNTNDKGKKDVMLRNLNIIRWSQNELLTALPSIVVVVVCRASGKFIRRLHRALTFLFFLRDGIFPREFMSRLGKLYIILSLRFAKRFHSDASSLFRRSMQTRTI